MENKVDISVILPIASSFGKDFDILFEKAIDSIKKQQVSINQLKKSNRHQYIVPI